MGLEWESNYSTNIPYLNNILKKYIMFSGEELLNY